MDDTAQRINEKVCSTAQEFNALVDEFAQDLMPQQVTLLQKKVALELLRQVVFRTPVDTGRARGNWQTCVGQAGEAEVILVPLPDHTPYDASPPIDVAGADALTAGMNALKSLGNWQTVFIFNNVPYIIYLEDGTSRQAPWGMLRLSLLSLEEMFK